MPGYVFFCDLGACFSHALARLYPPTSFTFDFQLNLFYQVTLLYSSLFTFFVIKLPSVYYLICLSDQVIVCIIHVYMGKCMAYCKVGFSK